MRTCGLGAIVIIGGIIGYIQAQSLMSLVSGGLLGIALLISAFGIMKGVNTAHYVALLVAAFLTAFFHYRFARNGLFMPSGLMAILAAFVTIALLILRPRRAY